MSENWSITVKDHLYVKTTNLRAFPSITELIKLCVKLARLDRKLQLLTVTSMQ